MASHNNPSNSAGGGHNNLVRNITAAELRRQREAADMRRSQRTLQRVEEPSVPLPPAFPLGIILGENMSSTTSMRNRMFPPSNNIHVNPNLLIHQPRLNPNNPLPIGAMNAPNLDAELSRSHTRLPALEPVPLPPTFPPGIILGEHLFSTGELINRLFGTGNTIGADPSLPVDQARPYINNSSLIRGMNLQYLDRQEIITNDNNVGNDWPINNSASELRRPNIKVERVEEPSVPLSTPTFPPVDQAGFNINSSYSIEGTNSQHLDLQEIPNHNNVADVDGGPIKIGTSKLRRQREAELARSHTKLQRTEKPSISLPPTSPPPGITLQEHPALSTNNNVNIDSNLSVDQARVNMSSSPPREGMNSQHLDLQEMNNDKNVADDDDDDGPNSNVSH